MAVNRKKIKYVPGTYAKKRPDAAQMADQYIREWETRRRKMKEKESAAVDMPPAICISRKIGVGALEIADILKIEENEAKSLLGRFDKEQRDFFKKAFGKKDASPYEFDLVINSSGPFPRASTTLERIPKAPGQSEALKREKLSRKYTSGNTCKSPTSFC